MIRVALWTGLALGLLWASVSTAAALVHAFGWDETVLIVAVAGFVARDELRAKWSDNRTNEMHERVALLEERWKNSAEMDHIEALAKRLTALETKPKGRTRST